MQLVSLLLALVALLHVHLISARPQETNDPKNNVISLQKLINDTLTLVNDMDAAITKQDTNTVYDKAQSLNFNAQALGQALTQVESDALDIASKAASKELQEAITLASNNVLANNIFVLYYIDLIIYDIGDLAFVSTYLTKFKAQMVSLQAQFSGIELVVTNAKDPNQQNGGS